MTPFFKRVLGTASVVLGTLAALPAQAGPYSSMYVFGDSLSDVGNLQILSGGAFPRSVDGPYDGGRFSDGPLWVESLAASLGVANDAKPWLLGGRNYAIAGARTGAVSANPDDPPGVLAQLGVFWNVAPGAADPNALYVLVAGGNDMRDGRTAFLGNSAAAIQGRQDAAEAAANNLIQALGYLNVAGARHVLIANLPNLGGSPEAFLLEANGMTGAVAASTDISNRFNKEMSRVFDMGVSFGLDMDFLNMAGIGELVVADALGNGGATFGITNVSAPCTGFVFSAALGGTACSVSLFSDALHPSAAAHQIIATAAFGLVPEPAGLLLAATALGALLATRRRA